jgi:S-DNA-T family DNA segregation ATPase FtsK/SpoIIIE
LICSLLYKATPRQLKLILIDPKRVELTNYEGIPHLKSPVITDSREAAVVLRLLVAEMEQRYKRLAELGVRNIAAYNEAVAAEVAPAAADAGAALLTFMPYIVVIIDELADMMMVAANDVEAALTRLAQMSRAVGIHLVLATQRPSVDVITGIIKANFPSRIAFQVSSKVDSRTILDTNGADALLGRGDMLYAPASAGKPIRVQGVFVPTSDVDKLARFWKKQGAPELDQAFAPHKLRAESRSGDDEEHDDFFEEAVGWVVRAKQASTSLLQRRLKVGYARAARLLDKMEERGIIGPQEGSKPRKVLLDASSLETKNQPAETP